MDQPKAANLRVRDIFEGAGALLPVVAVLVPASGVLVRTVAYGSGDVPLQSPLYLALGAPLNELLATGALALLPVVLYVPLLLLIRPWVAYDTFLKEKVMPHYDRVIAQLSDVATRTAPVVELAKSLDLDSKDPAVQAKVAEVFSELKALDDEFEEHQERAKAEAAEIGAEEQRLTASDPLGWLRIPTFIAKRRWARISFAVSCGAALVLIAALITSFPAGLIGLFGSLAALPLAMRLTRRRGVTMLRLLPSVVLIMLTSAVTAGLNDQIIVPGGYYFFKAGTPEVSNQVYEQVADWGDTVTLLRCGDHSGQVATIPTGDVLAIVVGRAASSPSLPPNIIATIRRTAAPQVGFQAC